MRQAWEQGDRGRNVYYVNNFRFNFGTSRKIDKFIVNIHSSVYTIFCTYQFIKIMDINCNLYYNTKVRWYYAISSILYLVGSDWKFSLIIRRDHQHGSGGVNEFYRNLSSLKSTLTLNSCSNLQSWRIRMIRSFLKSFFPSE